MEERRSSGRSKRPAKPLEDGSWDCSVCTYKNSPEAYKCEMCDVRKGTSTRKPKINPQLIAQQVAQQYAAPLTPPPASPTNDIDQDVEEPIVDPVPVLPVPDLFGPPPPPKPVVKKEKGSVLPSKGEKSHLQPKINKLNKSVKNKSRSSMMKHVDRNSARQMSVTVDNVTVVITDYQPKKRKTVSDLGINSTLSDASDSSSNASNDIHNDIPHSGNLT